MLSDGSVIRKNEKRGLLERKGEKRGIGQYRERILEERSVFPQY